MVWTGSCVVQDCRNADFASVVGDDLQALHDHVADAGGSLLCFTPGWDPTRLRPLWRFDL